MSAVIGSLRVNLGIDTAAFSDGLKKAQSSLAVWGRRAAIVGAAAGATVGVALGRSIAQTIAFADEMAEAAEKLGVPVEALSRLKYAAEQSGSSFEDLQGAIAALSRRMGEALDSKTSAAAKTFEKLGVAVVDAEGKMRPTVDVLTDLAAAFAGMPNDGAEVAAAMQLMGRNGSEMVPLLNQGAAGLRELTAEASQFGVVVTEQMGENAGRFNDAIGRLRGAFAGISADLAERLLPHLADFAEWAARNGPAIAEGIGNAVDVIARMADGLATGLSNARDNITLVKSAVSDLAAGIASGLSSAVEATRSFVIELEATLAGLRDAFLRIGRDAVAGLLQGLRDGWVEVTAWLADAAAALPQALRDWWQERSPSRVFAQIGAFAMEGLREGLASQADGIRTDMEAFAGELSGALRGMVLQGQSFREAFSGALGNIGGRLLDSGFGLIGRAFNIPGFANGTRFAPGGLARLHELGGEIVDLPRGSRVYPHDLSREMMERETVVRVFVDDDGRLQAAIQRGAGEVVRQAAPAIVGAASARVVPTLARHQRDRAGGEYR